MAASHVTTQNLGGKKYVLLEGNFDWYCGQLCLFQNLKQSLKIIRSIGVRVEFFR